MQLKSMEQNSQKKTGKRRTALLVALFISVYRKHIP